MNRLEDYTLELYLQDGRFSCALIFPGKPYPSLDDRASQKEVLADDERRIFVRVIGGKYPLSEIIRLARLWRGDGARGVSPWQHIDLSEYGVRAGRAAPRK